MEVVGSDDGYTSDIEELHAAAAAAEASAASGAESGGGEVNAESGGGGGDEEPGDDSGAESGGEDASPSTFDQFTFEEKLRVGVLMLDAIKEVIEKSHKRAYHAEDSGGWVDFETGQGTWICAHTHRAGGACIMGPPLHWKGKYAEYPTEYKAALFGFCGGARHTLCKHYFPPEFFASALPDDCIVGDLSPYFYHEVSDWLLEHYTQVVESFPEDEQKCREEQLDLLQELCRMADKYPWRALAPMGVFLTKEEWKRAIHHILLGNANELISKELWTWGTIRKLHHLPEPDLPPTKPKRFLKALPSIEKLDDRTFKLSFKAEKFEYFKINASDFYSRLPRGDRTWKWKPVTGIVPPIPLSLWQYDWFYWMCQEAGLNPDTITMEESLRLAEKAASLPAPSYEFKVDKKKGTGKKKVPRWQEGATTKKSVLKPPLTRGKRNELTIHLRQFLGLEGEEMEFGSGQKRKRESDSSDYSDGEDDGKGKGKDPRHSDRWELMYATAGVDDRDEQTLLRRISLLQIEIDRLSDKSNNRACKQAKETWITQQLGLLELLMRMWFRDQLNRWMQTTKGQGAEYMSGITRSWKIERGSFAGTKLEDVLFERKPGEKQEPWVHPPEGDVCTLPFAWQRFQIRSGID